MSIIRHAPSPKRDRSTLLGIAFAFLVALQITGCGGSDSPPPVLPSVAEQSQIVVASSVQGVTPFIRFVALDGKGIANVRSIAYTIEAKPDTVSKPVSVRYTRDYLARRGYSTSATTRLTVPVFGLYSGYANQVSLAISFDDGSSTVVPVEINTASYTDPFGFFEHPTIRQSRAASAQLGYDFFFLRSHVGTPVIVDTDGEIRWLGAGSFSSRSTALVDNGFLIGSQKATELRRLELDGTYTAQNLIAPSYTAFHHALEPGKLGWLAEMNAQNGGQNVIESVLAEITPAGTVIAEWDFATLLSAYMSSHGDDPSLFVRGGVDWFHMNAAIYDPRDDSLIVSSRESFVVKIDYRTGDIVWVLGDPTKYWHSFPSLRAKALTLADGNLYPVGQHSLSITNEGLLMLFNNGTPSLNQPAGAPVGEARDYSAVSAYAIDSATHTAREVWRFDYAQSILSPICSSARQTADGSFLLDYATASNSSKARLIGLDPARQVVFDFEYTSPPCTTAWSADPIALDAMSFK